MVKGVSKRVVVVRFPGARVFEQAIFIVREDVARCPGVSADEVLSEACRVAEGYVRRRGRRFPLPQLCFGMAGAALTGLAWLLTVLVK